VLAVFWVLSGALGLARFGAAQDVLTQRGVAPGLAAVAVALGAAIDLLLGLLVLIRRWMPAAALGMVLVSFGYLAAGSLVAPDLWLYPLGPFVKVAPAAVLALVALAVAEER
jgi:DoxX-like family